MRPLAIIAFLAFGAAAAAAQSPFQHPVKDCRPCRFSPGPAQPIFDLTFIFDNGGGQRSLTGLRLVPEGEGGREETLDVGPIAASDFPDGFILADPDLNFDGYDDLSLTSFVAATNETAKYWVYRPQHRDFVALERVGDTGAGDFAVETTPDRELYCHIHDSAIAHVDYWYRVEGHRAIAVRQEAQDVEGGNLVSTTLDLTVEPPHLLRRVVVGFVSDSPERTAFLRQLEKASARARALYHAGNTQGAVAVLAEVMKDKYPDALGDGKTDRKLAAELNDYGFYLQQTGRPRQAVEVLQTVITLDADRTVAYLNLADAEFVLGDKVEAKYYYTEYQKRMTASGLAARIPARVVERSR
jgi:tetratricopeptide (TPR) repeat protein